MTIGKLSERLGQPGVRVAAGKFANLNERGYHHRRGACERDNLAVQSQPVDGTFDGVLIEIDPPIVEEAREADPRLEGVADCFAELGFGADLAAASSRNLRRSSMTGRLRCLRT